MTYFLLPRVNNIITYEDINLQTNNTNNDPIISFTLFHYLDKIKKQIDSCSDDWDSIKKYTNPYEYIHTTVPNSKTSICKLNPLSRSFYKMVELINTMDIFENNNNPIKTFHLAEGPGGFIEAVASTRNNSNDIYYGMTLIDQDTNIPGWKKSKQFLEKNSNVIIETGVDGTGNLFSMENFKYCYEKYKGSMDFITGDGGFDFSIDFNKQESLACKLLIAQVSFAVAMQKHNGNFILKIFDTFTKPTIDILYLLSCLYRSVYIMKPNTSRYANSEKYVICKGFKLFDSEEIVNKLLFDYHNLSQPDNICSLFNRPHDCYYLNKIEEYNAILGQQQIENISSTISLIENSNKTNKLETYKKNHIQRCISWCMKHKVPHNKTIQQINIFLAQ